MHRFASVCPSVCLWLDRNSLDNNSCLSQKLLQLGSWYVPAFPSDNYIIDNSFTWSSRCWLSRPSQGSNLRPSDHEELASREFKRSNQLHHRTALIICLSDHPPWAKMAYTSISFKSCPIILYFFTLPRSLMVDLLRIYVMVSGFLGLYSFENWWVVIISPQDLYHNICP